MTTQPNGAPMQSPTGRSILARVGQHLAQHLRLFSLWPSGALLGVMLLWLPLSIFTWCPGHALAASTTRGLFRSLDFWAVCIATMSLWAAATCWAFTWSLLVEGAAHVFSRPGEVAHIEKWPLMTPNAQSNMSLPVWSYRVFSVPLKLGYVAATLLALPGVVTLVAAASTPARCGVAAVLGTIIALTASLVAGYLTRQGLIANEPYPSAWYPMARSVSWLHRPSVWLRRQLARALPESSAAVVLSGRLPGEKLLHPDHFAAVCGSAIILFTLLLLAYLGHPNTGRVHVASCAFLFLIAMSALWLLGAFRFHLARVSISPVVATLLLGLVSYCARDSEHEYPLLSTSTGAPSAATRLAPGDVLSSHRSDNLVVLTTTGGGIWAASWTTLALARLLDARPTLEQELRVLSGVSGGAVGSAFYVAERLEHPGTKASRAARNAYIKATQSSIDALSYGLLYRDLRLMLPGLGRPRSAASSVAEDRATLLEDNWCKIAACSSGVMTPSGDAVAAGECSRVDALHCPRYPLSSLVAPIRAGHIPLPILNTAVLETGRRLLVTPLAWGTAPRPPQASGSPRVEPTQRDTRAWTLDEYLFDQDGTAELSLWTAARLAATFPYVSPAARAPRDLGAACIPDAAPDSLPSRACRALHHVIDGGYYDNYGVASALDWLSTVLDTELERRRGQLTGEEPRLKRVLIVQLRSSPDAEPGTRGGADAYSTALFGPLRAVVKMAFGAARQRNDIQLDSFLKRYQAAFGGTLQLDTVLFQPATSGIDPLNWRLTPQDVRALEAAWPEGPPRSWPKAIRDEWYTLERFLDDAASE